MAEDCSRTASERVESGLRTLCSRRWSSLRLTLLAELPEPLLEYRVAYTSALVDLGPQNAVADILIDAHGDGLNTLQQLLTCPIGSLDMRCAKSGCAPLRPEAAYSNLIWANLPRNRQRI